MEDILDTESLARHVIEKMRESDGYREMSEWQLGKSLVQFFEEELKKEIEITRMELKSEEKKGKFPNLDKYKEKYDAIEKRLFNKAMELGATSKEDLENLEDLV